MSEEARQGLILDLLHWGQKPVEIKRLMGASYSTICWVRQCQTEERRPRDCPAPVRTAQVVCQVCQRVAKNPRMTVSGLAQEFNVTRHSMQCLLAEDLGMKSYQRVRVHKITPGAKERRLECTRGLLNWLKDGDASKSIIFTNEKYFTLAQYSNRQNDKIILQKGAQDSAPDELRHIGQVQCAAGIMFLGTVSSCGKVTPLIWVEKGIKIDANAYVNILQHKIKPWLNANFEPNTFLWQQDGAMAHTAAMAQEFLCKVGWDFWAKSEWPPSSPDCAPLDYSIWDRVAGVACREDVPNIHTLKCWVNKAWHNLGANYVRRVCRGFRHRLEAVINAEGGALKGSANEK